MFQHSFLPMKGSIAIETLSLAMYDKLMYAPAIHLSKASLSQRRSI